MTAQLVSEFAAGKIEHLYIKGAHGKPTVELEDGALMRCEQGFGIVGDVHANRLSPRQVLITMACELEELRIAPGSLRENIVIASGHPEWFQPGSSIVTQSGVEIRLTMFCEPCQRIGHVEENFAKLVNRRGVLGFFMQGGAIRRCDSLRLIPNQYAPLAESPYHKFLDFMQTIPAGRVVRYIDVTVGIGVADSFVRAIPGYIKRSLGSPLPLHRIVNGQGHLLDFIPNQARELESEGIAVRVGAAPFGQGSRSVSLSKYLWQG